MHRAAARALRTTCLATVRTIARPSLGRNSRLLFFNSNAAAAARASSHHAARRQQQTAASQQPLRSSMFFRRLPAALVSSIVVGYGAWYGYNSGYNTSGFTSGVPASARSLTSTQGGGQGTVADTLPTRTVLVVGADELRQGTIVGEVPVSKATGDGRRIVEMLTPEQATDKLRSLEQSFSVNRGQGVTRYDLVQLPSNDPIEDDHAEKIVEVPTRGAGAEAGTNSDWMFWGVFDGHS